MSTSLIGGFGVTAMPTRPCPPRPRPFHLELGNQSQCCHTRLASSAFLTAAGPLLSGRLKHVGTAAFTTCKPRSTVTRVAKQQSSVRAQATPAPPRHPPTQPRPGADAEHQPTPLVGASELVSALTRAGKTGVVLVVVFFRAKWCRSCATLAPKVARVAAQFRVEPWAPSVDWYTMDIVHEHNRVLTADLNVHMLPTFHFYRPIPQDTIIELLDPIPAQASRPQIDTCNDDTKYATVLEQYLERSFIAGPFGSRRLHDNLKEFFGVDV